MSRRGSKARFASFPRACLAAAVAFALACPVSAKPKDIQDLQAAGVPDINAPDEQEESFKEMIKELSRAGSGKGNGNQFCAIIISNDGQMSPSPEANELSSMAFGGRPGRAEIVATNSSYTLTMDAPLGFSLAPPGGNDSTVFRTSYSGVGATNFSATPGNVPVRIKIGSTTVTANMVATKTASPFPAGFYRAEVTLRCE